MTTYVWLLWPYGMAALQGFVKKSLCSAMVGRDGFVRLECSERNLSSLMAALDEEGLAEIAAATKIEAQEAVERYVAHKKINEALN